MDGDASGQEWPDTEWRPALRQTHTRLFLGDLLQFSIILLVKRKSIIVI